MTTSSSESYFKFVSCISDRLIMESDSYNPERFYKMNSIRAYVLENIEEILSKNPGNEKFVRKLLGIKDNVVLDHAFFIAL